MAAYGALVSLMHIIDTLHKHPSPPISIHPKQTDSLTEKVTFLENFLEIYNPHLDYSKEADPLESSIADAAYAAEDIIEAHVVDQIKTDGGKTSPDSLYEALEKVIGDMDLIKREAMEIKQTLGIQHQLHTKSTPSSSLKSSAIAKESSTKSTPSDSLKSSPIAKKSSMVGAEEALLEMKDKLTSDRRDLQIIPIVGMGGSGKTTLAINIYQDRLIKEHFHVSAWVAISQEYNIQEMLVRILRQLDKDIGQTSSVEGLGEILYKHIFGRKYLIILDDMWSIKAWDGIRRFLPDNKNGSRIVVTTRLSNLGSDLSHSKNLEMSLLNEVDSWELLSKTVFGEKSCPPEMVEIGKRIGKSCKGLPLSIVVIGGLLSKSNHTSEFWESMEENLNSIVNSEDDERCVKILHMSYKQLPVYLKPCLLWMGIFGEDKVIRRSTLVELWVAEGILKPISGKSLEEIAKVYLKDLADRNLVLIDKIGISGEIKYCKIHDLLRDMCLREVEKERFYHFVRGDPPRTKSQLRVIKNQRRVIFPMLLTSVVLGSLSCARSIICDYDNYGEVRLPHNLRLLRTLKAYDKDTNTMNGAYFFDNVFELVNLRYLAIRVHHESKFSTSIDLLWNLRTLIIRCSRVLIAPNELWKLHQLRHLEFTQYRLSLPEPPSDDNDIVIMENLHTLKGVKNLVVNETVVKRIPNVKKLHLWYNVTQMKGKNYLSNLECFSRLENFHCYLNNGRDMHWQSIRFPHSLKKLSVLVTYSASNSLNLEDIMSDISSLPLLEKLVLKHGVFKTGKWETIEGQFPSLKFLLLHYCNGLEDWIVSDKSHFPVLQKLRLDFCDQLKEIPSEVGEIATLKSIELDYCSVSAVESAKKIVEEQEDLYGDQLDLHVQVRVWNRQEELKSLATANFQVKFA
ncbi:putative late blight resistance protein homolog R1B-16 [Salvia hispanica]|uniref:putative late blight resistance protein homolog R1B-16 n=1 Tax=Salvia hispanica TaxID=49212 RepID=UPI00200996DD|nr:putative late blight resistance protein homolog R1B-16 [Salvia hispanica]